MLGWLTKKLLSAIISLMTLNVPHEQYQHELDSLPGIEERLAGVELAGWVLEGATGESGTRHTWFSYPPARDSLPWLVCLHGFNTDGRVFERLAPLADSYRIVAYNFPERSPLYRGAIGDFTALLDEFFTLRGIDTLVLAGNSFGGVFAMDYAGAHPRAAVTRLLMVSSTVFGVSPDDTRELRGMADKLLQYPDYKLYYLLTRGKAIVSRFANTDIVDGAPSEAIAIKHIDWYRQLLSSVYYYDAGPVARRLTIPVLAVHGGKDRLVKPERAQVAHAVVPGGRFVLLAEAGHSLVFENADDVIALVRGWEREYDASQK